MVLQRPDVQRSGIVLVFYNTVPNPTMPNPQVSWNVIKLRHSMPCRFATHHFCLRSDSTQAIFLSALTLWIKYNATSSRVRMRRHYGTIFQWLWALLNCFSWSMCFHHFLRFRYRVQVQASKFWSTNGVLPCTDRWKHCIGFPSTMVAKAKWNWRTADRGTNCSATILCCYANRWWSNLQFRAFTKQSRCTTEPCTKRNHWGKIMLLHGGQQLDILDEPNVYVFWQCFDSLQYATKFDVRYKGIANVHGLLGESSCGPAVATSTAATDDISYPKSAGCIIRPREADSKSSRQYQVPQHDGKPCGRVQQGPKVCQEPDCQEACPGGSFLWFALSQARWL